MVPPHRPYPAPSLSSQTFHSIQAASQCCQDRINPWDRMLSASFLLGVIWGLTFSVPATVACSSSRGAMENYYGTPLWTVLSCHFSAETPGFALERGDSWKNVDGAEEQCGTQQPAKLGGQQHCSPPRDTEARPCCLSYYLPAPSFPGGPLQDARAQCEPIWSQHRSCWLFAPLSLPISLQTPLFLLSSFLPIVYLPPACIQPQPLLPSLLCLLHVLLASPPASFLPCVLIYWGADWM